MPKKINKPLIDYLSLKKISPEAARKAVIEYFSRTKRKNIASCARIFGISRVTIYDILKKEKQGDLTDKPKTPKKYLKVFKK